MKPLNSIQSELEYEAALSEASTFFDDEPKQGTQEAIRFESLLKSIEAYESVNHVI